MTKLKLRVSDVLSNGAVILQPAEKTVKQSFHDESGKELTQKQVIKARQEEKKVKMVRTQVHPSARLQFVPLPEDGTTYNVDDIFEVTIKKK